MNNLRTSCGSAPGRLDFLGGVADYSGSLVLEMPIQGRTTVEIQELDEPIIRIEFEDHEFDAELDLGGFNDSHNAALEDVSSFLRREGVPEPVFYVAGCLAAFLEHIDGEADFGLHFKVSSTVPQSIGVSSSAALEVATMRALEALWDIQLTGTLLARLAQRAENVVVGAPCGLMDQLSSAYGIPGALLPILCRPDILGEPVPLPAGIMAVGWPSGVKHSVAGAGYGTARAAAFMGKQIFEKLTGRAWGFASEITPGYYLRPAQEMMPRTMPGADFLREFSAVNDPLSKIDPDVDYPVFDALRFPIEENERCAVARTLLAAGAGENIPRYLEHVGQLMYASHAGYGSIGLGTPETDAMVEAVEALGAEAGFYGARVGGGGCGGTVVVLLEECAIPRLHELSQALVFAENGRAFPLIR